MDLSTISRFSSLLPYKALFTSKSCRSVAPCREIPAKTPRARDQERISAVNFCVGLRGGRATDWTGGYITLASQRELAGEQAIQRPARS